MSCSRTRLARPLPILAEEFRVQLTSFAIPRWSTASRLAHRRSRRNWLKRLSRIRLSSASFLSAYSRSERHESHAIFPIDRTPSSPRMMSTICTQAFQRCIWIIATTMLNVILLAARRVRRYDAVVSGTKLQVGASTIPAQRDGAATLFERRHGAGRNIRE
jgi:hypothetical protein